MNVLMTTDTVGGIWNYALQLCRGLEHHGVHVTLATMGAPLSSAQAQEARLLRNVTVHESRYRLEWMEEPWRDVAAAGEWLLELEQSVRADVVHLNSYAHGALPWSAPVLVVGHSCVLSWWHAVHGSDAPAEWDRYRAAVTAGLHEADVVIAPTRAMLDALMMHYVPPAETRVIANGYDPDELPLGARDAFGRYARSASRQPIVLAAGRVWDESKNFATLATAARSIRWPVFIAGQDLSPDGRQSALSGVQLLGMLAPGALRQWLRRASIFVHPSIYEPFGLAPLEAARAGCALVLSDIPSLREIWRDAALYVPPRDAAALAEAVNSLAAAPQLREHFAQAALARSRRFTARRMARAYHQLYLHLVRRSTPGDAGRPHKAAAGTREVACAS